MTKEDKQLLLKDICARLPYGVMIYLHTSSDRGSTIVLNSSIYGFIEDVLNNSPYEIKEIKPYFRPLTSMTEEEWLILKEWIFIASDTKGKIYFDGFRNISAEDTIKAIDYLISHHFDYRGLIEKGLALEAKEDMYGSN